MATFASRKARMAELVDALDSKSGFSNGVQVRFLFRALKQNLKTLIPQGFQGFSFCVWDGDWARESKWVMGGVEN
jgi:hypothetical protein